MSRSKNANGTGRPLQYSPGTWVKIDATGLHYKDLNRRIRALVQEGARQFEINNVYGQRYIGTNLYGTKRDEVKIRVQGTPGSDLGAFMDGPTVEVFGNVQDATGNTMNDGRIIVHGSAGDVLGYGMRGGEIYIRGNVGYRVGIHMKEYMGKIPVIVIGGTMQDFFGEYMAGGKIIILNRFFEDNPPVRESYFIGTGMHGGSIFIRGDVNPNQLGAEVGVEAPTADETTSIRHYTDEFCRNFGIMDMTGKIMKGPFWRLFPKSARPYGRLYAY